MAGFSKDKYYPYSCSKDYSCEAHVFDKDLKHVTKVGETFDTNVESIDYDSEYLIIFDDI